VQFFSSQFSFYRWKFLQVAVDERYKQVKDVGKEGGAALNHCFLCESVETPWERAVSHTKVPYYIK
jgi:hypothetical protein